MLFRSANGPALIDTLRRDIDGITPVSPGTDSKETRFASVSPLFEAGQVYVPHPKWIPQVQDIIDEWCGFPFMKHDDNVDSTGYALMYLRKHKRKQTFGFIGY